MSKSFRLTASTGIHKGDRQYQQDQVLVLPHPRFKGCVLTVLADGMGGRSGGRKASDQVMLTARQLFDRYSPQDDDPCAMLIAMLQEAHIVIRLTALTAEQEPHSTAAALLINPDGDCHWAHAGDSRIYHFRNGITLQRTRDHSYVQSLVDRGEISETEANTHPQGHLLVGCLGGDNDPPKTTHTIAKLQLGDVLLVCSDGLWHYFSPSELALAVSSSSAHDATRFLIDEARLRARGRGDNLSLAVIKIEARSDSRTGNAKPGKPSGQLPAV